ncbi:Bug family tripartite tricarboxylate transporter substrate binding protein [Cupriavidus sp. NPDC089707]|uniref:Bug family tripartite tricarboxylate transporter substrate binding protein n=1 Tax=Cupriavidus sp. NPDC089707 TaxID=3363963 RepID=UPI003823EA1B
MSINMLLQKRLCASMMLAIIGTIGAIVPALAQGDAWPAKPVRLIVPFPPGGGGDKLARTLAPKLEALLKTSLVIENKGGGNGNIALQSVATAPADGYTIGLTIMDQIALSPSLYDKLPFDSVRDFAPVGLVVSTPYVFTVEAKNGAADLAAAVARAKKEPGSVSIGYPTVSVRLATEMLQRQSGARFNMVPYRGISQSMPDLLGGRVDFWAGTTVTMRSFIEAGKVRGVAITSAKRSPALPNIPTVAESGYPGFELVTWYGIMAPAGTPRPVIDKLNAQLNAALNAPEIRAKLEADGALVLGGPPERLAQVLKEDMGRLGPMIKQAGIKPD